MKTLIGKQLVDFGKTGVRIITNLWIAAGRNGLCCGIHLQSETAGPAIGATAEICSCWGVKL